MLITFTDEKKLEGDVNALDDMTRIHNDLEKQFKNLDEIHYE